MINERILEKLRPHTVEEECFLHGDSFDRSIYMSGEGAVVNSRKLLKEGRLITLRPHTRFIHFPAHSHDYIEVVYMCSGETSHIINGETVELREGELLFLAQNAKQEILPAGENDIAVNFIVLPEFFDRPLAMIDDFDSPLGSFMIECLRNGGDKTSYLHFEVSDVPQIQNLIENLIFSVIESEPPDSGIMGLTMGLLFLELLRRTERIKSVAPTDELMIEVHRYIDENYINGSLAELAKRLHYDPCWLSREIKKRTGKNYTDIVADKRLSRACFFLKNTDMSIVEISETVGYCNASYFHRIFKQKYGASPASYRK